MLTRLQRDTIRSFVERSQLLLLILGGCSLFGPVFPLNIVWEAFASPWNVTSLKTLAASATVSLPVTWVASAILVIALFPSLLRGFSVFVVAPFAIGLSPNVNNRVKCGIAWCILLFILGATTFCSLGLLAMPIWLAAYLPWSAIMNLHSLGLHHLDKSNARTNEDILEEFIREDNEDDTEYIERYMFIQGLAEDPRRSRVTEAGLLAIDLAGGGFGGTVGKLLLNHKVSKAKAEMRRAAKLATAIHALFLLVWLLFMATPAGTLASDLCQSYLDAWR